MQGLESLAFFVVGAAPFPLQGFIFIHDMGARRQHPPPIFLPPQAPEKQLLQHPAEGSGMENVSGGERLGHFGGPFWATPFPLARGSQNGPRPQGFASPRNNGAPLTAASRSERTPHSKRDRKSTRLNSSHSQISYAVFCLKKKI